MYNRLADIDAIVVGVLEDERFQPQALSLRPLMMRTPLAMHVW